MPAAGLLIPALLCAVFVGMAAVLVKKQRAQKRRGQAFQAFAATHGLTFRKRGPLPDGIPVLLQQRELVPPGFEVKFVRNVMAGHVDGDGVLLFDCEYARQYAMTSSTLRLPATIVCLRPGSGEWKFACQAHTGKLEFLEVERMEDFLKDSAATFRRSAGV